MTYFSLFWSCTLTKGAKNSCLIDTERSTYCSIPNDLYDILKDKFNVNLEVIKQNYVEEDFIIIKKHLFFLKNKRFLYFHSENQAVTHDIVKEQFSSCYEIEDLILDIESLEQFSLTIKKVLRNIETIQLRIYYAVPIIELSLMVEKLSLNGNTNIEIILKHNIGNSEFDYKTLFQEYNIISKMFIMNFGSNKHIVPNNIIGLKQFLKSHNQCGIISKKLFSPNLRTFLSSRNCNSCLNRKVSIDVNGNIKNCPSMLQSFGNIKETTLKEAIENKNFKKYWLITKDQISICKDCEFRHVCTDCRAYIEAPEDDYSKPLKCGYNPYTNEWQEWSTSPLKQKAIEFYGLKDLSVD